MVCVVATLAAIFANSVRAERVRRGWKQADVAARCSWSVDVQGAVERGSRQLTLDDIATLCAALELPLSRMLLGADPDQVRPLGLS